MDMVKVGGILLKIIWRSFFLQAWWNFERLQSIGLLYTLLPLLDHLYKNEREKYFQRKKFYEEYFNTNPLFFPIMLGALVKMEMEYAGGKIKEDIISSFKVRMMSTLGAIGDTYGWAGFRPLSAFAGILIGVLISPVAGLIVFVVIYNSFSFFLRIRGFFLGYRYGVEIVDMIGNRNPYRIAKILFTVNSVLSASLFSYLIFWSYVHQFFSFEGVFAGFVIGLFMVIFPGDFVILFYYIILITGDRLWPEILKM